MFKPRTLGLGPRTITRTNKICRIYILRSWAVVGRWLLSKGLSQFRQPPPLVVYLMGGGFPRDKLTLRLDVHSLNHTIHTIIAQTGLSQRTDREPLPRFPILLPMSSVVEKELTCSVNLFHPPIAEMNVRSRTAKLTCISNRYAPTCFMIP